jgi:hypothetical protein
VKLYPPCNNNSLESIIELSIPKQSTKMGNHTHTTNSYLFYVQLIRGDIAQSPKLLGREKHLFAHVPFVFLFGREWVHKHGGGG